MTRIVIQNAGDRNLTFLFSDIEGSTERWNANTVAMRSALQRHDRIMRSAIIDNAGAVFKTIGDAFCASFPSVPNGLAAAIQAQRQLTTEDFSDIGGLRVRMAIHCGEVEARNDDYFGPTLNYVARLQSAAAGGQILVSSAVFEASRSRLPSEIRLRLLGSLPLKGFDRPEPVYQVMAIGLDSTFRALPVTAPPPNNLPRERTSFVGRETEVASIGQAVRDYSVTTIVGTGGIGKTRLAIEAASTQLEYFIDGLWFVTLAPVHNPDLVTQAILSTLGLTENDAATPAAALIDFIANRRLLLILDNCEHLQHAVSDIVRALMTSCPQLAVLATSREPLNVEGERIHRLGSFQLLESEQLFEERARSADATFRITDETRPLVSNICDRLGGIALAIELAAARLRSMTVNELSRQLSLRVLSRPSPIDDPRQQTMYSVLDWSYQLLSELERSAFRSCSAFAGAFTSDGATDVTGFDAFQVLDLLASLVDKSLIVVDRSALQTRYRLLTPIREFAREHLERRGDAADVFLRHAKRYKSSMERAYDEWDRAPMPDWLLRYGSELDDVRAALEWSLAKGRDVAVGGSIAASAAIVFLRESLLREGVEWSENAIACAQELTLSDRARLYYTLSMLLHNQGSNEEALAAARQAVMFYRDAGDTRGLARSLSQVAHHLKTDPAEARSIAEDAVRRARDQADPRLLAVTLQRCAFVFPPDNVSAASEYFQEAVFIFRSLDRDDETARALTAWSDAVGVAGDFARSAEIANEALALAKGDERSYVVTALASLYIALGEESNASALAEEALELLSRRPHPIALPLALYCKAALIASQYPADAARLIGYAAARLAERNWHLVGSDCVVQQKVEIALTKELLPVQLQSIRSVGAALSEADVLSIASRV